MLKKLKDLLAQVRDAEKSALAILKSEEVGSKIDGTVQQLRRTADEIEERIHMLKEHEESAPAKTEPKAPKGSKPPAENPPPAE